MINSAATFNEAVAQVNAGDCNEIDVSGTIIFTSAPTPLTPDPTISSLTISGAGSGILDGKDVSAPGVRGLDVALGTPGQQLVISGITMREFEFDAGFAGNGGALAVNGGPLTITDSRFISNIASDSGGAVHASGAVTSSGSHFEDNSSGRNGGAIVAGSCIDIGSNFERNVAGAGSGTGYGGALVCSGASPSEVALTQTQFTDNTSDTSGGALWTNLVATVEDASFTENDSVGSGGAIATTTSVAIENTEFISNTVTDPTIGGGQGGALWTSGSVTEISGGLFKSNVVDGDGGAIATTGAVYAEDVDFLTNRAGLDALDGGGAILASGEVEVVRSAFVGNEILRGGGGAIRTSATFTSDGSEFRDNGHTGASAFPEQGGAVRAGGDVAINDSIFDGNSSLDAGGAFFTTHDALITDGEFTDNDATQDGGAGWIGGDLAISNSIVRGNSGAYGGAFSVGDSTTVEGSTFRDNQAAGLGGAVSTSVLATSDSSFIENIASGGGGAGYIGLNASITNSTFYNNRATGYGGTLYFDSALTSAVIRFSTLVNTVSGSSRYGTLITSAVTSNSTPIPLTLIGTVLSAASPVCGIATFVDPYDPLVTTADSRSSYATDDSCASTTTNAVRSTSLSSLGFDTPLTTDVTPGMQVLIPSADSVLNDEAPVSLLPSGVTTDQLGALRNSADGFTSVGAVQVRPMAISAPANQSVAPGADAAFTVTAVPGVGTSVAYQWQSSRDGSSWSAITGNASALTSSLVLPSVTTSDSGLRVRARVTDISGSEFSSGASLTVSSTPAPGPAPAPTPTASATPTTESPVTEDSPAVPAPVASPAAPTLNVRLIGTRMGSDVVVRGVMKQPGITRVLPMYKVAGRSKFTRGKPIPVGRNGQFTWRHRSDRAVIVYFTAGRERSKVIRVGANSRS